MKDFLAQKRFAVVGSFKNESKYAYRILKVLINKGYEVYPVNPSGKEVEGIKCHKNISEIPIDIDVVNLVTPPAASEKIVNECIAKNIKRVWLQPGAESDAVVDLCRKNNISVIHSTCIMLESL